MRSPSTLTAQDMIAKEKGSECYIICTQPRKIAAISIAERVSYERSTTVGGLIGYQVRLDKKCSEHTRLLFCTTGGNAYNFFSINIYFECLFLYYFLL